MFEEYESRQDVGQEDEDGEDRVDGAVEGVGRAAVAVGPVVAHGVAAHLIAGARTVY